MFKKILKSYDYSLIGVYLLLCIFGLVMVYSSSMVVAVEKFGMESDYFYKKQLLNLVISFVAFLAAAWFPYKAFKIGKVLKTLMLLVIALLISVHFFGSVVNNAKSWIDLGVMRIQPSEFAKLAVIIYLGSVYSKKQAYINDLNRGLAPPLVFLGFICFIVFLEPDFGTAAIIFLIGLIVILCSGINHKTFFKLAGMAAALVVIVSPIIYLARGHIFTEVRMNRINAYLSPFQDAQGIGYQLVNSYLAIGSGGVKGLGLGQSVQKLGYIPEPQTDFIMAIIAEELGIFGVAFVILGLAYIVLRGIYIGVKCQDPFGTMIAIGISSMIGIQAFINLGGVSGLIPITGVPLPFISYGGSSLLVLSLSLGVLVNVAMFNRYEEKYKTKKENDIPSENMSNNRNFYKM
ncbi:FtsW/RodA/SpoVE family cell cycle protein [Rossellomorea marisflavi]|uniref:FtsW/RodA/SpoVE family cell cycle protein n=1 Tax=Rossellomorea marisflavi TaxID=189381 RepID=UPI00285372CF|nr:FtsW/RodA/SpoVE family cell cycle protein [Rossellomorea marisflavi]MDR4937307.1 FtsW/RodA/SpoVE family cell cycle protein [Rossellomorea marisflavi]